jgi:hypothetical protein
MFKELNPILHSELRLGIMSILLSVEEADFVFIREETGATAGNISVQIEKRTRTVCKITEIGVDAFEEYVEALKSYLEINR